MDWRGSLIVTRDGLLPRYGANTGVRGRRRPGICTLGREEEAAEEGEEVSNQVREAVAK